MESMDNLKSSLSAYKGHLSKAINSFNAIRTLVAVNPSFTKPFGTHTIYQGRGGGVERAPLQLSQKPLFP